MSKLFFRNALAALVLTFPIAVLADTTGTPTLSSGSTLNLDTGAVAQLAAGILLGAEAVLRSWDRRPTPISPLLS
jgi:hypothetical protein